MIVLSNELYIEYDSVQIACTTDFTLNIEKESITSLCNGWNINNGANKTWSIDFSAIVKRADSNGYLKFSDLFESLNDSNEPLDVALKSAIPNDNSFVGRALLSNLTKTSQENDAVRYTGTLNSYGPLSVILISIFDNTFDNTFN